MDTFVTLLRYYSLNSEVIKRNVALEPIKNNVNVTLKNTNVFLRTGLFVEGQNNSEAWGAL